MYKSLHSHKICNKVDYALSGNFKNSTSYSKTHPIDCFQNSSSFPFNMYRQPQVKGDKHMNPYPYVLGRINFAFELMHASNVRVLFV